ncbi:MAG: hypothetical protein KGL39_24630 [Patescibacteria group bacterium]|nr:hypothetical protein [Patescibacteria group bacterium]
MTPEKRRARAKQKAKAYNVERSARKHLVALARERRADMMRKLRQMGVQIALKNQ